MLNTQNTQTNTAQPFLVAVKVDPTVRRLRIIRIILYISFALWAITLIASFVVWLFDRNTLFLSPFNVFNDILLVFYAAMILIFHLTLKRFWNRLEERRQRAAAGDRRLIADQQPVPNANALALPLTIGQRPKGSTFLIFFGIMAFAMIIAIIVVGLVFPRLLPPLPHHKALPPEVLWIIIGIMLFMMLIYCGIFFVIFYYKVRQQVTITQDGLIQMNMFHRTHSVSWRDARLCAINGIYGSLGYKQPAVYELSSEHDIIRWSWIRRNNARVMFIAKPTVPPEEYESQMQGLLSIIVARTGLPLCDLRKKP